MNAVARIHPKPIQDIEAELAAYEPQIVEALPPGITPERFKQVALAAITRSMGTGDYSDLVTANRQSLFAALVQASGSGLLPDGKEGALVRRKQQVAWMPMVQGIIKLARNSGLVSSIVTGIAYKGERFEVYAGDRQEIVHVIDLDAVDGGEVRAAYAIAKLRNPDGSSGDRIAEVMTKRQIEKVKAISTAGDKGPWGKWYDQMAKKTALHRLFKLLPRDADDRLLRAVYSVEEEYDFAPRKAVVPAKGPTIEGEPQDKPKPAWPFTFISDNGEVIEVTDSRAWTTSWESLIDQAVADNALDRLRADWDRNREVFAFLRKEGYADAVAELEDEIRIALGLETVESTGRTAPDFVERMERKYAKPTAAAPMKATVDAVAQGTNVVDMLRKGEAPPRLEDSMPPAPPKAGKAGPAGAAGGAAGGAKVAVPWLEYVGDKTVVRSADSPKAFFDGISSVLARIGTNEQWVFDYARDMAPHLASISKHKDKRVAKLASTAYELLADASDKARAAARAEAADEGPPG